MKKQVKWRKKWKKNDDDDGARAYCNSHMMQSIVDEEDESTTVKVHLGNFVHLIEKGWNRMLNPK